ncbi:unnamed protein product [Vitrella brassicaformis CCMP3155]|uniref:Carbamoyltransferase n=3 Tax=Vitrella brassicaformis TaxID=1169539 RepID=A0A0G4FRZ2_VITBC|nr:unnamed protein product [Vitrella brassicaformis CCMP3155]|eukprot:CEM17151.1 unnamed protein product [Vitrella brassicaformis CCMP3155]
MADILPVARMQRKRREEGERSSRRSFTILSRGMAKAVLCFLAAGEVCSTAAWVTPSDCFAGHRTRKNILRRSKPSASASISRLSASAGERAKRLLILGLNKYSHDAACCIVDTSGAHLYGGEKERLSRVKHDGGEVDDLVDQALTSVDATLDDVAMVVQSNHHFRIAPFEDRLPWAVSQGHYPPSYIDPLNIFAGIPKREVSHHLAHAWSVITQAPFDEGLVVVMDGMGESYRYMADSHSQAEYLTDLDLLDSATSEQRSAFIQNPRQLLAGKGYREAESAYLFSRSSAAGGPTVMPLFKRWTEERSPPELFNHGFENMESMGAVYSRVSSQIFGDWNVCGKVMGLAPWAKAGSTGEATDMWKGLLDDGFRLMEGNLLLSKEEQGGFRVNWDLLESLPHDCLGTDPTFMSFAPLAWRVQRDLENAAMTLIQELKERTGARNLCLVGGVALNSVLNGRICRELGFDRVFIPPFPGDEGIAFGCAMAGLHHFIRKQPAEAARAELETSSVAGHPVTPYSGYDYTADPEGMDAVLDEYKHWIVTQRYTESEIVAETAQLLADGKVVAWFQGGAEMGPRALGHRSILADPRNKTMVDFLNKEVKHREAFRPFAPSVIAEEADGWFEDLPECGSPYMSITAAVREERRGLVPAVCHVDGTARLQTVRESDEPLFYRLLQQFFKLTGIPMVVNTSFNIKGEPIVEEPGDALRSFLATEGAIHTLIMGDVMIERRPFPTEDVLNQVPLRDTSQPLRVQETYLMHTKDDSESRKSMKSVRLGRMGGRGDGWVDFDAADLRLLQMIDNEITIQDILDRCLNEASVFLGSEVDEQELEVLVAESAGKAVGEEVALEDDSLPVTVDVSECVGAEVQCRVMEGLQRLYSRQLVYFEESSE